jgi:hypothetical protein
MENAKATGSATAETGMRIRQPVELAFEAIVNPDITTTFWFSKVISSMRGRVCRNAAILRETNRCGFDTLNQLGMRVRIR